MGNKSNNLGHTAGAFIEDFIHDSTLETWMNTMVDIV